MDASNLLLDWETHPPFDRARPARLLADLRDVLRRAGRSIERIEADAAPTWVGIMVPLESLSDDLDRAFGVAQTLAATRDNPDTRAAMAAIQPEVAAFYSRLYQSRPVFDALRGLADGGAALSTPQRRAVDEWLHTARMTGVGLEAAGRDRVAAIEVALAGLYHQFSTNVMDERKAWRIEVTDPSAVAALPAAWRARAAASGDPEVGPWAVTLDQASQQPVMAHSPDRALRERVWRGSATLASSGARSNAGLLPRILALRAEAAALLGFESYARMSLSRKTAGDVEQVEAMLRRLGDTARDPAVREIESMNALARAAGAPEAGDLRVWDVAYWSERLRESRLRVDEETLRPYLPLEQVLSGLFALIESLFGVRLESADGQAPVWHPDVRYFRVREVAADGSAGAEIAGLYLDAFERVEEKRGGAWSAPLLNRSARLAPPGQSTRLPLASVVCNQAPPAPGRPALMRLYDVEVLFHEFGHALHHALSRIDESLVTGLNGVEWDAIELPSMFLEAWAYHPPFLRSVARHIDTGAPLAEETLAALAAGRRFLAARGMLRGVELSLVDLGLHDGFDGDDPETLARQIYRQIRLLPPDDDDRILCTFQHIFAGGYAAGYYSYIWSDVLACDAFAAFDEDPAQAAETGRRFRETVLGLGGSQPAMETFRAFRGRDPTTDALLAQRGLTPTPPATTA